jgi:hypothetical protein
MMVMGFLATPAIQKLNKVLLGKPGNAPNSTRNPSVMPVTKGFATADCRVRIFSEFCHGFHKNSTPPGRREQGGIEVECGFWQAEAQGSLFMSFAGCTYCGCHEANSDEFLKHTW